MCDEPEECSRWLSSSEWPTLPRSPIRARPSSRSMTTWSRCFTSAACSTPSTTSAPTTAARLPTANCGTTRSPAPDTAQSLISARVLRSRCRPCGRREPTTSRSTTAVSGCGSGRRLAVVARRYKAPSICPWLPWCPSRPAPPLRRPARPGRRPLRRLPPPADRSARITFANCSRRSRTRNCL